MSIIPGKESLVIYQGARLDETFTFFDDDAATELTDLTDCTAAVKVRADYDSPALLSLASAVFTPPAADGIVLGGTAGTVRIYARSVTTAALVATDFTVDSANGIYTGVWDLEITNAAGETDRYLMGPVTLSREATY